MAIREYNKGEKVMLRLPSARPGAPLWAPPSVGGLTLRDVFGNAVPADRPLDGTLVYASAPVPARRLEMMLVGE